jgi:hypothetical protein
MDISIELSSQERLPNRSDETVPAFPMDRVPRCPFDPPPALRQLNETSPISRVRLWDQSTPWLVTGYAEQRQLLADPRVSADTAHPPTRTPARAPGPAGNRPRPSSAWTTPNTPGCAAW